jgi:hypothetical protein
MAALVLTGCPQPTTEPTGNPPEKPVITSVVPGSTTSLTVTWGAVSGAAYYEVYRAEVGNEIPATATVSNISTGSTTLPDLNTTVYNVWVKAINEHGSTISDPWTTAVYNPAMLEDIKGTWVSSYGEEYIINSTEFISAWGGITNYKGHIVNIRTDDDDSEDGYITIRYTENTSTPEAVGNYYVIRWEGHTAGSTITITGASNDTVAGRGYSTILETEMEYVGTIGTSPFAWSSDCYFITGEGRQSAILGSWTTSGAYDSYTITDKLVIYEYGAPLFVGEIVNVRNLDGDKHYITFKYVTNDVDNDLVGTYCVLYWTEFSVGDTLSVKIATAYSSTSPGDEGKDDQDTAEQEYILEDSDNYFSDLYEFTRPSSGS